MSGALLGIDAGTSSVKICAFTRDGRLVARASRPVPLSTPQPRWAELDLERYASAVQEALGEVLAACGPVSGVGFATTAPTTILLDRRGRALGPGIPFLDNRAEAEVAAVGEAVGGSNAFFARTGNRLSPSTCSAATVRWLMRHEPERWRQTASIGFLNSWLGAWLTGRVAAERTQASYSGMFQLHAPGDWSRELTAAAGVPAGALPELLSPYEQLGAVSGEAVARSGLPAGTPVALGSADTAASAFALGIRHGGQSFESAGTSGVLTFCLDQANFDDGFMNRCHVFPGRWLAHGAMSTPGAALTWLLESVWPELGSAQAVERLAGESEPGARGLVFLPYMAGERSPIWDPRASGAWLGLRLDTTRADMARAVYEAAAYGLRQIMERAEQRWGWRPQQLLSVGGGARSRLSLQIKADVMQAEYLAAELPDAAALGAALMGGIAAGVYTGPDDRSLPIASAWTDSVSPGAGEALTRYERNFAVYKRLYPALREAMHHLAELR